MRFSLTFVIYIVVGVLVAAGVIGDEANYFNNLDSLKDVVNMLIAVLLWPLVLLGVDVNISDVKDGVNDVTNGGGGGNGGGK
ncbi:MAG: hypothetical protein H0V25_05060 [Solirubrobacterales bacterium]|nr:hypothetical protein [Solirubrobacterales bacterium]